MWDLLKSIFRSGTQSGVSNALYQQIQRLFNGEDWYQSQLGNRLSNAQSEANQFTYGMQLQNQSFNAAEAEKQRQFQIDYYNQIQSPQAQVQAYKSAGVNPAAVFGNINAPAAAGGSSAASSPLSGQAAGAGITLQSIADLAFQQRRLDIEERQANADIRLKQSESALNEIDANFRAAEKEYGLQESASRIEQNLASVQKQMSDISVNDSVITLNGEQIRLIDSQVRKNDAETSLAIIRQSVERLDYEKAKKLLPFVEEMQRAEIALRYAQSENQRFQANLALSQSKLAYLNYLKDEQLLDAGYYDTLVSQAKRDYKWTPVNNVLNGIGKIAGAVAGIGLVSSKFITPVAKMPYSPPSSFVMNGSYQPGVPYN